MNKRGFTLVELLAVLVILGIIRRLIIPKVFNIVNDSKDTLYQNGVNTILSAAYDYSLKNLDVLKDSGPSYITLGELKANNLFESNIINQKTGTSFSDDLIIKIMKEDREINPSFEKREGEYIYTLFSDNTKLLSIELDLSKSGSNYYTSISVGGSLPSETFKVKYDGVDVTDSSKIVKNISKSDNLVDSVDTSNPSIYDINYTALYVKDDKAYSNTVIWKVVVTNN